MELMSDMGEHFESVSAALSMFNEVGQYHLSFSTPIKLRPSRYPNDSICSTACGKQFSQHIDDRNILFCCYGDDVAILLSESWHSSRRLRERILVHFDGV